MLLSLLETHHSAAKIHESHSATHEWQLEKVINVLTQWWPRFQLSNATCRKNVTFVVGKRLNRVTQFVSLMKRQRSTFSFCSSRREGKNKEHARLRWTRVVLGPRQIILLWKKWKSSQYLCENRQGKIVIPALSSCWDQYSASTVCGAWITFSVYHAFSW